MQHFSSLRNRSRVLIIALMIGSLLIPIAPTSGTRAQDQEADARERLDRAATAMLELESFHFLLTTPIGKSLLQDQIELGALEGTVVRPNSFSVEFSVKAVFLTLDLAAIGIGDSLWVTDPTREGSPFIQLTGEGDGTLPPQALLNPDALIRQALDLIQNPEVAGTEEIEGVETTRITGLFDPNAIGELGTAVPDIFEGVDPLEVTVWIDAEDRVIRMELDGALLPAEVGTGKIVRRIDLSRFNEPIQIEAPS